MHYDMFDLIGLILKLPPKAPVPTYRHSIHLHSKRCRIALGRTWQSCCNGILSWPLHASGCPGFCQHAAPSVSIIHQGLTMQCSTISIQKKHSCKEVQIRFQAQLIFSLSSQLFWWQNIPVQWHAGAPARRHSRPYLAQLLEICLLR